MINLIFILFTLLALNSDAAIKNKITIGDRYLMIVDADPSTIATQAHIGSIAFLDNGSKAWQKKGSGSTDWKILNDPTLASFDFSESVSGNLITQKARTSSGNANDFTIIGQDANGTDQRGGNIVLKAGRDTGNPSGHPGWGKGADLQFWSTNTTVSGSSFGTYTRYLLLQPTLLNGITMIVGDTSNGFFQFDSLNDSGTPGVSGDTSRILFGHASRGGMIKSVIQGITNGAGAGGDIVLKPGIGSTQDGNITCYGVGLVLPKLASAPSGAVSGTMYYDTTTNKSYTYDGTTWQAHW